MKKLGYIFSVLLLLITAGCVSTAPVATENQGGGNTALLTLYRLRALDPVRIELLGIPNEKMFETTIDERGDITIPYIVEPIHAEGMTTSALEREIERLYLDNQIYRNITVNILTSAKIYYVEGYVARPMEYPLTHRITLLQAIATASGYTEYANKKNVTITRNGQVMHFNAKEIEKTPSLDVPIEAGDRIKVHRSRF